MTSTAFPFSAVVGLDDLGLALCLSALSPGIGGVLVRGEKGTAKTTMVRGLAAVLPEVDVVEGCRFACAPHAVDPGCPDWERHGTAVQRRGASLVELPVGASEDRVVGSLHLDSLLSRGAVTFEPGLLASANRGVLYVDEVNLLPDHLVDTLLDSAATGRARVEREGVSVSHAARFVLVGTMNPEEGDLRPQLLDRFGLTVSVAASRDPATRVDVMRRRLAYEADPVAFIRRFASAESALAARIAMARERLEHVRLGDAQLLAIATICAEYDVDGLRGDLVTARAAAAHAAWHDRDAVAAADIRVAARLALPHRRRRNPFDTPESAQAELEEILDRILGEEPPEPDGPPRSPDPTPDDGADGADGADDAGGQEQPSNSTPTEHGSRPDQGGGSDGSSQSAEPPPPTPTSDDAGGGADVDAGTQPESTSNAALSEPRSAATRVEKAGSTYAARLLRLDRVGQGTAGRRSRAVTSVGRHVRGIDPSDPRGRGIAVGDTVRRAASAQHRSERSAGGPVHVRGADLRRSLREGKEGNLVVFVVDTSGSMGARRRMANVKTAVLSLLLDAYQRRDKVAVVTFARDHADVLLPPTGSVELARTRLDAAATGGRTPLAEGLRAAHDLIRRERAKDPLRRPLLVVLTDGRATSGPDAVARSRAQARRLAQLSVASVVLDCESPRGVRLRLAADLARALGAELLALDEVDLAGVARPSRPGAVGAA